MKFAVNFSNPLIRLLRDGSIKLDLIKCPDWEGMLVEAQPYGPIHLHFDLEVGLGNTCKVDFARIKALLDSTGTPHVNTHLVTPKYFNPEDAAELKKINALWRDEIQCMIDHLGADTVALEHYPWTHANDHIRPAVDPSIFSQVILDTGCMFLLDIAHARITADTLGVDVKDYICALPLDRLVEMHITGVKTHSGVLTDHFELGDGDWVTFRWVLDQIKAGQWRKPEIVAFEYGGIGQTFMWRTNEEVLKTQVPILFDMVTSLN